MKQEVKSPIETMIKLRPFLKEAEDILTIKPCYMEGTFKMNQEKRTPFNS